MKEQHKENHPEIIDAETLEKLAKSRNINQISQSWYRKNRGFLLMPLDYLGITERGYFDESPFLNDEVRRIMQETKLRFALHTANAELEFAHYFMPKGLLEFSHFPKKQHSLNNLIWLDKKNEKQQGEFPDCVTYEGYSHLILSENGLEVVMQELDFFEGFSDSPNKLFRNVEKKRYPIYLFYNEKGESRPIFIFENRKGRKEILNVSNMMKMSNGMEHMFVAYWGSGRTTFDYHFPKPLNISLAPSNITPEYIRASLQKAIKDNLGRKLN